MSTFLARHYDPALVIDGIGSREELESRQVERLARALSIAIIAGTTPRRLGGDATDEELAIDKKRARRAGHVLGQSLKQWTKRKPDLPHDSEVKREGAQIVWPKWLEEHCAEIRHQLRCVTTWAVQNNEERWGKSAVVYLENEMRWIEYALRD